MGCPDSPPIWYTMASRNHSRAYRKTVGKTGAEKRGKFRKNGSNKRNRKRTSYDGYSRAIDILHALYLGEVKYHELSPIFQNIGKMLQTNQWIAGHQKQHFFYFLKDILRPGNVPVLYQHNTLFTLFQYRKHWVRYPDDWNPSTYWDAAQGISWGKVYPKMIEELIEHLFVKYPVPRFMNNAWETNNHQHILWFIYLAKGRNIRDVKSVPIQLTSKMAHYFTQAPEHYEIKRALLYGQVLGLGGNVKLLDQLYHSSIKTIRKDELFFRQVIQFFMKYPELIENGEVSRVIDFINAQKYYGQRIYTREGGIIKEPAAEPTFSLKGRTDKSLLRLVNDWHSSVKILGDNFKEDLMSWKLKGINDFDYQAVPCTPRYRIVQLINNYELWLEGKSMMHCVSSYAHKCQAGTSSIWAMTKLNAQGAEEKCVTIELGNEGTIWQVKGKQNRQPTENEMEIIRQWTHQEKLTLSIDYA